MKLEILQRLYNACNPDEPLDPADPRNVKIDEMGTAEHRVRGANWVSRLARQIELSGSTPVCRYFTGLRGTGKSTELRRLAERLGREDGAHLFTVVIDAEEALDLTAEVDIPDILASLVFGAERAVLKLEGRDPDDALTDGFGRRFWSWLTRTDVTVSSIDTGLQAGVVEGRIVAEMKTRPTLRQRLRSIVSTHLTSFLREVHEEIRSLEARAKKRGYAGLFLVFDSLEKLQGTSTSWEQVLQSAERVFASDAPYLQLPVHVLYTIPPALVLRLKVDVHYLPMIKLHEQSGEPFAAGFAAAREIVRRRIEDVYAREIFGAVSGEARIKRLIEWSGGYPREIVRLLQSMLEIEDDMNQASFERVLSHQADAYRRIVLASGAVDWLASVVVDRALVIDGDERRMAADRMLSNNVVLRYLNSVEWFDVHPAVRDLEQLQQAVERLRAARDSVGSKPPVAG